MKVIFVMLALVLAIVGCNQTQTPMSEIHDEGDEESGTQYTIDETYDQIRGGARLILSYDSTLGAFVGTVENTTNQTLNRVRIEVHLSNGTELGPTTPKNLNPKQKVEVKLDAIGQDFNTWSAHAEVG